MPKKNMKLKKRRRCMKGYKTTINVLADDNSMLAVVDLSELVKLIKELEIQCKKKAKRREKKDAKSNA